MSKIALISTHDIAGGAAIAAYRLFRGLKKLDADVDFFVRWKNSEDDGIIEIPHYENHVKNLIRTIDNYIKKRLRKYSETQIQQARKNYDYYSTDFVDFPVNQLGERLLEYDVINIHWSAHLLGLEKIQKYIHGKKIFITMHDEYYATGGCHYTFGCEKFKALCGNCPQLGSYRLRDLSYYNKKLKFDLYKHLNIQFIAPSKWLHQQAVESSAISSKNVHHIPYGLDTNDHFYPDKEAKKQILAKFSIHSNPVLILALASSLDSRRKGMDLLFKAICTFNNSYEHNTPITFLFVGNTSTSTHSVPENCLIISDIKSTVTLRQLYSAADLFIIPSREDNLPNTVLEALACGTPAMGFNIGGIPDMIVHRKNGYLITPFNTKAMARQISKFIENRKGIQETLSKNARHTALTNYTLELQAKRYLNLFK